MNLENSGGKREPQRIRERFRAALLSNNPFLNSAPEEFASEAFDMIEYGSSPRRENLVFNGEAVKYTDAIKEIFPDTFNSFHIVKVEAAGLSPLDFYKPGLEGTLNEDLVIQNMAAGIRQGDLPLLSALRSNGSIQSFAILQFANELLNDAKKERLVIDYLDSVMALEMTSYHVDKDEFLIPMKDRQHFGSDFDNVGYQKAIGWQQGQQAKAERWLTDSTKGLRENNIDEDFISKLGIEIWSFHKLIIEMKLEGRALNDRARSNSQHPEITKIAEKFNLDVSREATILSQPGVKSKGISL